MSYLKVGDKSEIEKNKLCKKYKKSNIKKSNTNKESSCVVENINPCDYKLFDIESIVELPHDYPNEFKLFCSDNGIKPPNLNSSTGKAWCLMATYKYYYFNRDVCEKIAKKFNIKSKDIIQQFNKVSQKGIKSNSDLHDKGKSYIIYPYELSNKHKMRKNFKFSGSEEEKNREIDKIKSTIKTDYITVPNNLWHLGHKNPSNTGDSTNNLILQPPIQSKYRDDYIFIDTLTKFPCPHKFIYFLKNGSIILTKKQIREYNLLFNELSKK